MKRGFAPAAVLVLLLMVAGLGLAVSRTTDLANVFQKPRASGISITPGHYTGTFAATGGGVGTVSFDISGDVMTGFVGKAHFYCDNGGKDYGDNTFTGSSQVQDSKFSFVVDSGKFWPGLNGTVSVNGVFASATTGNLIMAHDVNMVCGNYKKETSVNFALQTAAGKSCTVGLSKNSIGVGEAVTVNSSGTGGTVLKYISRTDTNTISGLGNPIWTDASGRKYYEITGSSVGGLTAGDYKVWCAVGAYTETGKCSGNPFCSYEGGNITSECNGYVSCSSSDNVSLTVSGTVAAKSCTISAVASGQTVTVTSSGTGGAITNYVSRADTNAISGLGNPAWTDSLGHKYYTMTSNSVGGLAQGDYKFWCNQMDDPGKCSGNPFCSSLAPAECAGWARCGTSDSTTVSIAASVPTCTGAPCTGDGRERVYTGGGAWHWEPADCKANNNENDCKNVSRCSWNAACAKNNGGGGGGGGNGTLKCPGGDCDKCSGGGNWIDSSGCSGQYCANKCGGQCPPCGNTGTKVCTPNSQYINCQQCSDGSYSRKYCNADGKGFGGCSACPTPKPQPECTGSWPAYSPCTYKCPNGANVPGEKYCENGKLTICFPGATTKCGGVSAPASGNVYSGDR